MTGTGVSAPPFDVFSLTQDVQDRFGWSLEDLNKVMEQLMPAAFNGFRHFGSTMPGYPEFPAQWSDARSDLQNPFAEVARLWQTPADASLTPFFGPEAVQAALAAQVSAITGLQKDAIQEMMPVAATLAMGQIARPFVHGEARNLLDAYLRGFARGRPKPQPTPVDYLQGYADAMRSFWEPFLQPADIVDTPPDEEPSETDEPAQTIGETQEENASEFDEMVSGWMAAGRDFQSNQFKALDSFFQNAAKNADKS